MCMQPVVHLYLLLCRQIDFSDIYISTELPKSLALASIGIRAMLPPSKHPTQRFCVVPRRWLPMCMSASSFEAIWQTMPRVFAAF